MKIAIISDTHDNLINLEKALSHMHKNGVTAIVHCGDACCLPTLNFLEKHFNGKIYFSLGNCDEGYNIAGAKLKNIRIFQNFGELDLEGIKIAFAHFPATAKTLFNSGNYDFVFHGHTHMPWISETKENFLANPGNLAGINYAATFAVLDTITKKLELKILDKL